METTEEGERLVVSGELLGVEVAASEFLRSVDGGRAAATNGTALSSRKMRDLEMHGHVKEAVRAALQDRP